MKKFDTKLIEEGISLVLKGLGEDPSSKRFKSTPLRVALMYEEILSGALEDSKKYMKLLTEEKHNELVILKNIHIYSMCEHHLLPFSGFAHVAYIPNKGKIMGLSTIAKLVDLFAKRLQLQERLTKQIADYLVEALDPQGVMVIVEAEHLCMTMRGAKKSGAKTFTSAVRGIFSKNEATRSETMSLLMRKE